MSSANPLKTATPARARGGFARLGSFGWRGVMSLGFLVAFVASFALAGFSYVFCLSLGQAQTTCCCHAASAQTDPSASKEESGPSLSRAPCCETRHFESAQASSSTPPDPAGVIAPPAVVLVSEIVPVVSVVVPRAIPVHSQERPLPLGRAPPPTTVHLRTVRLLC